MLLLILALQAISPPSPIIGVAQTAPVVAPIRLDPAPQLVALPAGEVTPARSTPPTPKDPWAILPCGGTAKRLVC